MNNKSCQRCCSNCRFAMPVEHEGEPLLVCPYRQKPCGRLTAVEPQDGCREFRERVRPKEGPEEGTCFIPLANMDGLCALVDAADYEWLSRYTWFAKSSGGGPFYACTRCNGKMCSMHRMIMNPPEGMVVDHKNRYGLDNHRVNLRNATPGQNCINRAWGTGVSGFRGVRPWGNKWEARIGHQRRSVYIGLFDDPAEAARAYDRKAVELHGEFACLNFPEEAGRRIVCLRGTARVCPAVLARVRRMLYGSSLGPSAPSAPNPNLCSERHPMAGRVPKRGLSRLRSRCLRHSRTGRPRHEPSPRPSALRLPLGSAKSLAVTGMIPFPHGQEWTCRCHAGKAGRRTPGIPVASRWVPLWARGPPWWAQAESSRQKGVREKRMNRFLSPAAP
jgi:hypothetical protein